MDSSRVVYGTSNSRDASRPRVLGFLFDCRHFRLIMVHWFGISKRKSTLFHQKDYCINDVSCY